MSIGKTCNKPLGFCSKRRCDYRWTLEERQMGDYRSPMCPRCLRRTGLRLAFAIGAPLIVVALWVIP